jgi:hypothetical protein
MLHARPQLIGAGEVADVEEINTLPLLEIVCGCYRRDFHIAGHSSESCFALVGV